MATVLSATTSSSRPADGWDELLFGPQRFRPLHLLCTTPLHVWLLVMLFGLVLAGWSVIVPQFHAPDEPNHADAVMKIVQNQGWPHPGGVTVSSDGVGAIAYSPYGSPELPYELSMAPILATDATPKQYRPTWDQLGFRQPAGGVQQIVQHPPFYYWLNAEVLDVVADGDDTRWDVLIGTLRLFSVLLVTPLPLLAYHATRRLADNGDAATVAAIFPLAVPQLTHIGSTINNDNLLIFFSGLAVVVIAYVLRGDMSLRTAGWTGVSIGFALFAKSLAIVLVPLALVAYLLAWRRARRASRALTTSTTSLATAAPPTEGGGKHIGKSSGKGRRRAKNGSGTAAAKPASQQERPVDAPFLLADAPTTGMPPSARRFPWRQILLGGTFMTACGGWWWVVNVVRYQTFQPETPGFPPGRELGDDWGAYLDYLANGTIGRWWGAIGWYELNLSRVVTYTASAIVLALVLLGVARARGWAARNNLLLMLWPTMALFGLMTYQATGHFMDTFHVTGISGRYLYAGFVALAVVVGTGAAGLGRDVGRWLPLLAFAAAVALQIHTAYSTIQHFWVPEDGDFSDAWDAVVAWTPWSATTMATVAWTTGAVALLALIACVVASARRADDRFA